MKKSTRDGLTFHHFLKAEDHLVKKIDKPSAQPVTRPLDKGCDYPLFQFNRISQDVLRRRAIVRG